MCQDADKTDHSAAEICVETNNFHQVLQHFNDKGGIINKKTTRFAIGCEICKETNLAVVNPEFDKLSNDTHQTYAVLPRCGHAFCSTCINEWTNIHKGHTTCPSCRALIYSTVCMPRLLVAFGFTSKNGGTQDQDIMAIRKMLLKGGRGKSCKRCPPARTYADLPDFVPPRGGGQGLIDRPLPIWEPGIVRFPITHPVELMNWVERVICSGGTLEDAVLHGLPNVGRIEPFEARQRLTDWMNSLIRDHIANSS